MNALLSKRDVFLVAPTGAGKSLCFQAPALVTGNLTLARGPIVGPAGSWGEVMKACILSAISTARDGCFKDIYLILSH